MKRRKRKRSRQGLFLDHLEDVSWRLLDEYREIVRDLIRRRCGVYVLYRKHRPYYIGLASNLMGRVNSHLKDRHKGYWDRFSVYDKSIFKDRYTRQSRAKPCPIQYRVAQGKHSFPGLEEWTPT